MCAMPVRVRRTVIFQKVAKSFDAACKIGMGPVQACVGDPYHDAFTIYSEVRPSAREPNMPRGVIQTGITERIQPDGLAGSQLGGSLQFCASHLRGCKIEKTTSGLYMLESCGPCALAMEESLFICIVKEHNDWNRV